MNASKQWEHGFRPSHFKVVEKSFSIKRMKFGASDYHLDNQPICGMRKEKPRQN
jgi:hypothetical protein